MTHVAKSLGALPHRQFRKSATRPSLIASIAYSRAALGSNGEVAEAAWDARHICTCVADVQLLRLKLAGPTLEAAQQHECQPANQHCRSSGKQGNETAGGEHRQHAHHGYQERRHGHGAQGIK